MSSLPNVDPRSAQDSAPTTPRSTGEQPKGGIGKLLNKMGLKLKIKSPFAHESPRSGGKASEARQSPTMADSTYASSPTKPLTKPTFPSVIKGGSQPVGGDDRDSARFSYSSSMDRASGSRSSDTRSSRSTRDSAMSAASQEAQMKVRDKAGMEYGSEDSGMVDRDSARDSANRESGKKDRETAPLDDALVVERKEEVEGEIQTGAGPETAIHSSKPIVGSSHVTAPKADISLPLPTLSPVPPRLLAPSPAPPALIATNPNSIRELGPPNLLVTTPPSPSPKGRFANIKQLIKNAVSSPGKSQNIVKPDSKFVVATADTSTPAQAGNLSSTLSSLKSCPEPSAASPASPFSPAGAKLPISSLRAVGGPSTGGTSRSPKSDILSMAKNLPPGMDRDCWCIEDYSRLQKIHSGYASSVYRAHCRYSNAAVVLKVYKPDRLHIISQHQLTRECRIHVNLDHPNIIRLYSSFRQADNVVLVQEYADGGDLLQLLLKNGSRLSERTAVTLVVQPILKAIAYLHDESIVHRDIKLENVLFAGSGLTLKLADFGLCINLREERSVTRAGTLDYMAPEVLKCPTKSFPEENKHRLDLSYSVTVDIWAMSVMTYELLNGCPPFTRPERKDTERMIRRAAPPIFHTPVSGAAKEFVNCCFSVDPELRPSAYELMSHPWAVSQEKTAFGSAIPLPTSTITSPKTSAALPQIQPDVPLGSTSEALEQEPLDSRGKALTPLKVPVHVQNRKLEKSATAPKPHQPGYSGAAAAAALEEEEEEEKMDDRCSAPAARLPFEARAEGERLGTIAETVRGQVLGSKK